MDSALVIPISLEVQLPPQIEAAFRARQAVRDTFSGRLPVRTVERLLTVVSELVTNSVLHGPGRPIRLTVTAEPDGSVRGEVEDEGKGEVAIREIEDERPGGMGLRIVKALTERWGVYDGSTHVWFELTASAS